MKPNSSFSCLPKSFWACVRSLSQEIGYTKRGMNEIIVPTAEGMAKAFERLGLDKKQLVDAQNIPTALAITLADYFEYRARVLNTIVESKLMDVDEAKILFERVVSTNKADCPIPMNKQKGDKKAPSYFTGIINTLIKANCCDLECDFEPRKLTTITTNGSPLRTMARWVDGAFPRTTNPKAVWEIKEYYYTTTFGSRVADGVYESLLDGLELEELRLNEGIHIQHYLMVDSHYTWWVCGKSYLCKIIDMLHMGYVDEVLFGSEVVDELPRIVSEWIADYR